MEYQDLQRLHEIYDDLPAYALDASSAHRLLAGRRFNGNGYDWDSLAAVFLKEKYDAKLQDNIKLDSEAGMFSVNSMDAEALREFVLSFKAACEDKGTILDLFSRAVHD